MSPIFSNGMICTGCCVRHELFRNILAILTGILQNSNESKIIWIKALNSDRSWGKTLTLRVLLSHSKERINFILRHFNSTTAQYANFTQKLNWKNVLTLWMCAVSDLRVKNLWIDFPISIFLLSMTSLTTPSPYSQHQCVFWPSNKCIKLSLNYFKNLSSVQGSFISYNSSGLIIRILAFWFFQSTFKLNSACNYIICRMVPFHPQIHIEIA